MKIISNILGILQIITFSFVVYAYREGVNSEAVVILCIGGIFTLLNLINIFWKNKLFSIILTILNIIVLAYTFALFYVATLLY